MHTFLLSADFIKIRIFIFLPKYHQSVKQFGQLLGPDLDPLLFAKVTSRWQNWSMGGMELHVLSSHVIFRLTHYLSVLVIRIKGKQQKYIGVIGKLQTGPHLF